MIYSFARKFCFVHIPKTAGTSVALAYSKNMTLGDVILDPRVGPPGYEEYIRKRFGIHKHSGLGNISRSILGFDPKTTLIAAVIRDPFEWISSAYRWTKKVKVSDARIKIVADRVDSFDAFVSEIVTFYPTQSSFLKINGTVCCNRLLNFDRLEQEWAAVCDELGITSHLPRRNVSPEMKIDMSTKTKNTILSAYSEDFRLFEGMC